MTINTVIHDYAHQCSLDASPFQVPPAELEDLLRTHPKVADVAVIGVPHARHGEAPRAYVVVAGGKNDDLEAGELHAFVNDEVAEYKRLAGGIEFIEAIPKSASGKILRKDLAAKYASENK